MDPLACNYNPLAEIDDGTCYYPENNYDCEGNCISDIDCFGECGGFAIYDECGVCNGDGAIYECGCVEASIQCNEGSLVCSEEECVNSNGFTFIPFITHSGTSNIFTTDLINPEIEITSPSNGDHFDLGNNIEVEWDSYDNSEN